MYSEALTAKIKALVEQHNTTQATLVEAILERALVDGDMDLADMDFAPAKPRGRRATKKAEPTPEQP